MIMAKTYYTDVVKVAAQPRSKRLRSMGMVAADTVTAESVGLVGSVDNSYGKTEHSHDNKSVLDKIGADAAGYMYLDRSVDGDSSVVTEKVKAGYADVTSDAVLWGGHAWGSYMDQPVRRDDTVDFTEVRAGRISADRLRSRMPFVDGLSGSGWQLWTEENGLAHLTVDRLTVRQVMTVFEQLIEKVRSVGGAIVVSGANGKIKNVTSTVSYYVIEFEDENSFVEHDQLMCRTFSGGVQKNYWVEVASVEDNKIFVAKSEFVDCAPAADDECVLMGNTADTDRQNMIVISASEDGIPRIDVLDGVNSKSLDGCLRTRLGCLDGISNEWFAVDKQPHGNGLYGDNVYLKGTFLLDNGEDVKTRLEVTEGMIRSEVSALRQDVADDKGGYLSNATFREGLSCWETENNCVFYLAGNRWIWGNGNVLSNKGDGVSVTKDMDRTVVRIRNKYICQKNVNMHDIPSMRVNGSGDREPQAVYLSFFYRCKSAGTLRVFFENVTTSGFVSFTTMDVTEQVAVTDGYKLYTCSGLWNGTGDFKLSFTGEIYVYMLVLSLDEVESLTYKYRTLFEQSEKVVRIAAENFDANGHILAASDIITTSKYNALISEKFNSDGSLVNVSGLVTSAGLSSSLQNYITRQELNNVAGDIGQAFNYYVPRDQFSSLFAQAVSADGTFVHVADLTAYVTKDAQGNLQSGVHVGAQHIALEGVVTANQRFKILSDGSMEAVNGKFSGRITANRGTVGGFDIDDYSLEATDSDGRSVYLSSSMITFEDPSGTDNHVIIGAETIPGSSGGSITCPMSIEVNRVSGSIDTFSNRGINIDVTGAKSYDDMVTTGNHALYISHGDICGLRLRVRRVSSSQTLSDMDSVILVAATSKITLTLPANPQEGQLYIFKMIGSQSYDLAVGDNSHYINPGTRLTKTTWARGNGSLSVLIWDKANNTWQAGYMSNASS